MALFHTLSIENFAETLDCRLAAGQDRLVTLSRPSAGSEPIQHEAIAAAIAWWRDAGVDHDFADEARKWLAPQPSDVTESLDSARASAAPDVYTPPPPPPAPPRERLGGARESWPNGFEQFCEWWQSEPSLDSGQVAGRVPPRGSPRSEVMVLVDHPEAQDHDVLLSGPQGKLIQAILGALGIASEQTYLAAALPRHMPMPDWPALAEAGLGEVLAHHVALAQPRRVLVFGAHVSSLLGHDPAKTSGFLPNLGHEGANMPILVAPELSALAARPRGKARLWQALLDWQAG